MKIIYTFLFAIFMSISVFAKTCPECLEEIDDDETHICFYSDSESQELMSSEEEREKIVLKRQRDDSETYAEGRQSCNQKRPRINSQIELKKPKLCELDKSLIKATQNLDFKTIKDLLANEANSNAADDNCSIMRQTFILLEKEILSDEIRFLHILECIIGQGADVMDAVLYGDAIGALLSLHSLHEHSQTGWEEYFLELLNTIVSKINVLIVNDEGKTALMIAVERAAPTIIQMLINAGSSVKAVDNLGTSVLEHALAAPGALPCIPMLLVQSGALKTVSVEYAQRVLSLANAAMSQIDPMPEERQEWLELIELITAQLVQSLSTAQQALAVQDDVLGIVLPMDIQLYILRLALGL